MASYASAAYNLSRVIHTVSGRTSFSICRQHKETKSTTLYVSAASTKETTSSSDNEAKLSQKVCMNLQVGETIRIARKNPILYRKLLEQVFEGYGVDVCDLDGLVIVCRLFGEQRGKMLAAQHHILFRSVHQLK